MFQGLRRLVDTAAGRGLDFMIGVIRIFGPIKKEIMGTGPELWAFIADIGRFFQQLTYLRRKVFTVERTALAAAFGAERITPRIATEGFDRTGLQTLAF